LEVGLTTGLLGTYLSYMSLELVGSIMSNAPSILLYNRTIKFKSIFPRIFLISAALLQSGVSGAFSRHGILNSKHVLCDLQAASQRLGSHSATPSSAHQGSGRGCCGLCSSWLCERDARQQSVSIFFFRGCNPLSPAPCMCITSLSCSQATLFPHSARQLTTITTEVDLGLPYPLVTWSLDYFGLRFPREFGSRITYLFLFSVEGAAATCVIHYIFYSPTSLILSG
jgi:hypothetical protein